MVHLFYRNKTDIKEPYCSRLTLMPNIAPGSTLIAFGDFKRGYQIVDRTPLRVLRDALTNKPFVHPHCTKRAPGTVVDSKAIRILKMKDA